MKNMKDIIKLSPVHKDYIWGGEKLKKIYDNCRDMNIVAESWILSAHKDGQSKVVGGEFDGLGFSEYLDRVGTLAAGNNAEADKEFPVLIKFIDAKNDLSIQVHPDDEYALLNEGQNGKTEMWYIMDCDEGATIYYGFNRDISKDEAKEALENGTFTDLLNAVPVKKGDAFFIPAGTVHAIRKGTLICEIQQNSNVTYRVFDYNRTDKDGNKRELHVDKALATMNLSKTDYESKSSGNVLAECKYFKVVREMIAGHKEFDLTPESFLSVIVTDGAGTIEHNGQKHEFKLGDSFFLPAQNGKVKFEGDGELILTTV